MRVRGDSGTHRTAPHRTVLLWGLPVGLKKKVTNNEYRPIKCLEKFQQVPSGMRFRPCFETVNGSGITTRWSPANAGGRALSHRIGGATSGAGHALVVQQTEDESSRHPGAQTQHQSSRAQFLPLSLSHRLMLTLPPCSFFHKYERDPSIF